MDDTPSLLFDLLCQLRLPEESIALALLYNHKFRRWQSAQGGVTLDIHSVCLAAISLAAKASEKPRRLREILVPAYKYVFIMRDSISSDLIGHSHLRPKEPKLTFPSELYDTLRSSLVSTELVLLRILKFELRLATPVEFLDDLLRDYVYYARADRSHYEDYAMVMDSMIGITARANVLKA